MAMKRTPRPRDPIYLGKLMADTVPDAVEAAETKQAKTGANVDLCRVESRPDPAHVSTSYAERANLTLRTGSRPFTRLTNALSKKIKNHAYSVVIHTVHRNLVRIHQALRCTPTMAAEVAASLWKLADMVKVLEEWEARGNEGFGS